MINDFSKTWSTTGWRLGWVTTWLSTVGAQSSACVLNTLDV
jgi:aspartate/methionine/tyrosine aminotransferase